MLATGSRGVLFEVAQGMDVIRSFADYVGKAGRPWMLESSVPPPASTVLPWDAQRDGRMNGQSTHPTIPIETYQRQHPNLRILSCHKATLEARHVLPTHSRRWPTATYYCCCSSSCWCWRCNDDDMSAI